MPEDPAAQTPSQINTHPLKDTHTERSAGFNYCNQAYTQVQTQSIIPNYDHNVCMFIRGAEHFVIEYVSAGQQVCRLYMFIYVALH